MHVVKLNYKVRSKAAEAQHTCVQGACRIARLLLYVCYGGMDLVQVHKDDTWSVV
jgi:hypothetical protein